MKGLGGTAFPSPETKANNSDGQEIVQSDAGDY